MFSRSHIAILFALVIPGRALAVAHHEQVIVQKLRNPKTKAVIGFRVHAIADPESYDHLRMHVGKMKLDAKQQGLSATDRRLIATGEIPGYVRATLVDKKAIPLVTGQTSNHELQELKVDVRYTKKNGLKPGDKVDLYTTYATGNAKNSYWHVYGMFDGPVNKADKSFVFTLPGEKSRHPEATDTL